MNRIVTLVGTLFVFFSCDSGEDVIKEEVNFYTVNIESNYSTSDTDNWVLASDANGEWLDIQPYEAGETIVLRGVLPETNMFNLTFLDVQNPPTGKYYKFYTYSEIKLGGTWILAKPLTGTPRSPIGTATVKLNNFTGNIADIKVSGVKGNLIGSASKIGSEASLQVTMFRDTSDLMLTFRQGNEYRTKLLTDVVRNSTVTVDALNAILPDHNFPVSFSGNTFYYVGFYGYKPNYHLAEVEFIFSESIDNDGGVPSLQMGYNDGYSKYKTIISYGVGKTYHTYYKFGSPITSFPVFENPSIEVVNNAVKNFSWNTDYTFSRSTAKFIDPVGKNIAWEVFGPYKQNTTISFHQFPQLLLDTYESLNVEGIIFSEGSVHLYLDDYTYDDFINARSYKGGLILKHEPNEYMYYGWGID